MATELVESALELAFPDRPIESIAEPGPSWNDANETVRVTFPGGDAAFLKVAADENGDRIRRERAVLSDVGANTAVPVPTVREAAPTARTPYLVTEPLAGEPLLARWSATDPAGREALVQDVGATLAHLHTRRFDEHGIVVGTSDAGSATAGGDAAVADTAHDPAAEATDDGTATLDLRTAPWTDVLVETIEEIRALATTDRFDRAFDDVIDAVYANRDRLDDAPAALLHGDPAKPNCVVTDDGGAGPTAPIGLLDWERAHVGDPARDLHRVREQQLASLDEPAPEHLVEALYAGYRDVAGSLPAGFEERAPLYRAAWTLGYASVIDRLSAYRDESRETVATLIETEIERNLGTLD